MASSISFSTASADNSDVVIPLGASISSNPFSLSPSVVNIKPNETVTWHNEDTTIHSITTGTPQYGFDGRFDSGPIQPGGTFSYTFDKTGTYQYFCLFHPWMTGLVNVGDGSSVDPVVQINFSTDKSSYQSGDNIKISGQVSKFIPNEQITVWITDSQGKAIAESHIETDDGSKFETSIPAGENNLWIPGSTYTVFAQYGYRSDVAMSQITFEPNIQGQTTQSGTNQTKNNTSQSDGASYPTIHKMITADKNEYVTVQTTKHLYLPGEQVKIFGSVWDGMFQKVGGPAYLMTAPVIGIGSNSVSEVISVQVRDKGGNIVLNQPVVVDSNGDYSTTFNIPQGITTEQYTTNAVIQTKAGLLNSLDASVSAKLGSSTDFVVATPSQFIVKAVSGDLNVEIGSNSTVSNFQFSPDEKKISFTVQGQTGTKGVTLITIPKAVLSGQLQVLIDGNIQPYNSDSVIVTSDNNDATALEINYHHSTHTVEIVGTQAAQMPAGTETVPEFNSLGTIVLAIATLSIIAVSSMPNKIRV
jgi:plastocyanin